MKSKTSPKESKSGSARKLGRSIKNIHAKIYHCKFSPKNFSKADYRNHHIEDVHKGRILTCKKCGLKKTSYSVMVHHRALCKSPFTATYKKPTPDRSERQEKRQPSKTEKRKARPLSITSARKPDQYQCGQCPMIYTGAHSLDKHTQDYHNGRSLCCVCGQITRLQQIGKHMFKHASGGSFVTFFDRKEISRHGNKGYFQELKPKDSECCKLKTGYELLHHVAEVHKNRLFRCKICKNTVDSYKNLPSHDHSHKESVSYNVEYAKIQTECSRKEVEPPQQVLEKSIKNKTAIKPYSIDSQTIIQPNHLRSVSEQQSLISEVQDDQFKCHFCAQTYPKWASNRKGIM